MSKRPAENTRSDSGALKAGQRPVENGGEENGNGVPLDNLEFEDEFEDEFESDEEDEILEAGVDGRPDAEREAEEREGVRDTK